MAGPRMPLELTAWVILGTSVLGQSANAECQTTEEPPVQNANGYSVHSVETVCDGIASSEEGAVEIAFHGGKRVAIFKYGSAYSFVRKGAEATRVLEWKDPKTLKISIGKIATLETQLKKYGEISIIYEIGR
jgi:hypothetical protein